MDSAAKILTEIFHHLANYIKQILFSLKYFTKIYVGVLVNINRFAHMNCIAEFIFQNRFRCVLGRSHECNRSSRFDFKKRFPGIFNFTVGILSGKGATGGSKGARPLGPIKIFLVSFLAGDRFK